MKQHWHTRDSNMTKSYIWNQLVDTTMPQNIEAIVKKTLSNNLRPK